MANFDFPRFPSFSSYLNSYSYSVVTGSSYVMVIRDGAAELEEQQRKAREDRDNRWAEQAEVRANGGKRAIEL